MAAQQTALHWFSSLGRILADINMLMLTQEQI